jgi:hypothetical protein
MAMSMNPMMEEPSDFIIIMRAILQQPSSEVLEVFPEIRPALAQAAADVDGGMSSRLLVLYLVAVPGKAGEPA